MSQRRNGTAGGTAHRCRCYCAQATAAQEAAAAEQQKLEARLARVMAPLEAQAGDDAGLVVKLNSAKEVWCPSHNTTNCLLEL